MARRPETRTPRRSRRRPRTALVLSGGGNLGALQVGQLRALVERGVEPDLVIGCSIGALNGSAFAANPTMAGVRRLESEWLDLQEQPGSVMPGSWIPSPLLLVRKGASLAPNEGLRATIERFLGGRERFEELEVAFECVATDVDAGTERFFSEGPLVEPILASAALPAVYPMVTIDDRRYFDGGVLDNVPITRAVGLGARKVYVLHVGLHGKPSPEVRRPADSAMIAYWIARNARFARDLAGLPKQVEAVVLPLGHRPEIRYDDFSRSAELMEQGYEQAVEYLDELDATERDGSTGARTEQLRADAKRVIDELRGKVVGRFGASAIAEPERDEVDPDAAAEDAEGDDDIDDEPPRGHPIPRVL